jgi:hypothetical protein
MSRTSIVEIPKRPKFSDKQSERDHRELCIDKVSVRGLRFPILLRDKAHRGVRFYNSTIKGITQDDSVKDGDVRLVDRVVERQQ